METGKKASIIFLVIINLLSLAAGAITQFKLLTEADINSIIPIPTGAHLTVVEILFVNFMAVALICMLICIITTYLVTDIPYTPAEIISNAPFMFMLIPLIILGFGIFNAIKAPIGEDKIVIAVCSIIYTLMSTVCMSCAVTVKYDAEE